MQTGNDAEIRILYLTRDLFPTFRVDIATLFGRLLPACNIQTTIVAARNGAAEDNAPVRMDTILHAASQRNRYMHSLRTLVGDIRVLFSAAKNYHILQVRNKIFTAIFAWLASRLHRKKFCYWMSFPYPEDDLVRVKEQGRHLGFLRAGATLIRGLVSKWLLYRCILPMADHVFVQSEQMAHHVLGCTRVPPIKISVIPMAADLTAIDNWKPIPVDVPAGYTLAYLGAMDRARRIDFLFAALKAVQQFVPDTHLLMIGDCIEKSDWQWLLSRAREMGVEKSIFKTGWVERDVAWSYLKRASIGVSALPDKFIFNSMSPTKAVEMLALGLPVVVTEHPDQGKLVAGSNGGLVTRYDVGEFARAIRQLIGDGELRQQMGQNGQRFIREQRCYARLSARLSATYRSILDIHSGLIKSSGL